MAHAKTQSKGSRARALLALLSCFLLAALIVLLAFGTARGADTTADTIGIGDNLSTRDASSSVSAEAKLAVASADSSATVGVSDSVASSRSLTKAESRTITVKDPDPVVAISAYDADDEGTVAAASSVGEINPLPTAPHVVPDTSGEGWMTGAVSAYDVASSSTHTASGRLLDDNCVTVAVPQSQGYRLGQAVEIVYNGAVVVATVTDTGGFEGYGRSLDLAGGVWKAFGASACSDWGVRTVSYRFI